MSKRVYDRYEAKKSLSELVERAAAGEEIVIANAGSPRAKLVPIGRPKRKSGGWSGRVRVSKDFDAPLPKPLADAFRGLK